MDKCDIFCWYVLAHRANTASGHQDGNGVRCNAYQTRGRSPSCFITPSKFTQRPTSTTGRRILWQIGTKKNGMKRKLLNFIKIAKLSLKIDHVGSRTLCSANNTVVDFNKLKMSFQIELPTYWNAGRFDNHRRPPTVWGRCMDNKQMLPFSIEARLGVQNVESRGNTTHNPKLGLHVRLMKRHWTSRFIATLLALSVYRSIC